MRDNTVQNNLPTTLVQNTTIFKTWAVTGTELTKIGAYVSGEDWEGILTGAFANTLSLFLAPMVFPFSLTRLSDEIADSDVVVGWFDVGARGRALSYFSKKALEYRIDMNELTPAGNFLDHEPYSKYSLYIPFVGDVPLFYKDIAGCTIFLRYFVDALSGIALAEVSAEREGFSNIIFSQSCQLAVPIPMSQDSTKSDLLRGTVSAALSALTRGALNLGGEKVTWNTTETNRVRSANTGRLVKGSETKKTSTQISEGQPWQASAVNGLQSVLFQETGSSSLSGTASAVSSFFTATTPYIKRLRPNIVNVENYGRYNGFACMEETLLGDHTGYCEVFSVHLDGFENATTDELSQIERLLKSGVIL